MHNLEQVRDQQRTVCIPFRISFLTLITTLSVMVLSGVASSEEFESRTCGCGRYLDVAFVDAYTNDDGVVDHPYHDKGDDGIDPRKTKDVATCKATVRCDGTVIVEVVNGYPGYVCAFWTVTKNLGNVKVKQGCPQISSPPEIKLRRISPLQCYELSPGKLQIEAYKIRVRQSAAENATYLFDIRRTYTQATCHNLYCSSWNSLERRHR